MRAIQQPPRRSARVPSGLVSGGGGPGSPAAGGRRLPSRSPAGPRRRVGSCIRGRLRAAGRRNGGLAGRSRGRTNPGASPVRPYGVLRLRRRRQAAAWQLCAASRSTAAVPQLGCPALFTASRSIPQRRACAVARGGGAVPGREWRARICAPLRASHSPRRARARRGRAPHRIAPRVAFPAGHELLGADRERDQPLPSSDSPRLLRQWAPLSRRQRVQLSRASGVLGDASSVWVTCADYPNRRDGDLQSQHRVDGRGVLGDASAPRKSGLAGARGRSGRGAPKSGARGWGAGRCEISGARRFETGIGVVGLEDSSPLSRAFREGHFAIVEL